MSEIPNPGELSKAWDDVCDKHRNHLKTHGVKLPRRKTQKAVWIATLYHFSPDWVSKDTISETVRTEFPSAATDQQVRHLKRNGWNLESDGRGKHRIQDWTNVSSEFAGEQKRRRGRMEAKEFNKLKAVYGNRCATCGAEEGKPSLRYGENDPVQLQQGHMDPELPADTPENLIPQCQFCNRTYKSDFTFDDKGRVRAIASIKPIERASDKVKREVVSWLLNQDIMIDALPEEVASSLLEGGAPKCEPNCPDMPAK